MEYLVCPDCGHDQFEQIRYTRTRFTFQYDENRYEHETDEAVEDSGDRDEEIICGDCGWLLMDDDELITRQQYDEDN